MVERDKKLGIYFLIILAYLNVLAWIAVFDLGQDDLEIIFFDVGQGDSIFIETPQKHQVLIDGGPTSAVLEKLGKEMPFYDRTIDLIILSHPEHDHLAGLLEVLKRYKVENVLWTGVLRDTAEFEEWQRLLEEEGATIKIAQFNQVVWLGVPSDQTARIEILYPFENLEGQTIKNTNNSSIIARLVFQEKAILFTGDAYKSVENELIQKNIDLKSNILKIGHHGSKTSTSEKFLEKVMPELAIISVGAKNSYGHPNLEVLEVLERYDIKLLRTDQEGDIKIIY